MTERFDGPIEALLPRTVTGGLIVAVLLTAFLSFSAMAQCPVCGTGYLLGIPHP
jgi:hypothetical protein